ncbi:MAG: phosphomannomutase, partial [Thermoleophilaceae bacterium]|nr:phosphomannomutase [Thermoleophilaceae bacterium]
MIDPSIFKAYDVRGVHPDQLDEDVAYRIGRAFPRVLAAGEGRDPSGLRVGLGRDMRLSAPAMAARYADGLRDEGVDVVDVGQVGTEMLYFAVGSRDLDGGLMCTASHNPRAYTGAKLVKRGAIPLSEDAGIGDLARIVSEGEPGPPVEPRGQLQDEDVADDFRAAAARFVDMAEIRPMKIVLDGGNGMAGPMVGPLLDSLPLDQVQTYWQPDGEFPDHEPNPLLPENRAFVIKKVLSEGAELGIAWDGDADRCFFIDDTGQFVDGDFLTALLAESVLAKEPGAAILYDVRASRAVRDVVERAGGTAHVNRVGHAFFKTRMREEGAAFGGEVSGHYYFRDFYCADSGTIPALLVLELLSQKGRRMSELLAPFREHYFISG